MFQKVVQVFCDKCKILWLSVLFCDSYFKKTLIDPVFLRQGLISLKSCDRCLTNKDTHEHGVTRSISELAVKCSTCISFDD